MNNRVQLITYVDRFGGGGIKELDALLRGPLDGLFGGVHLLPFYCPIDGADTGFDPTDHRTVDARLGDWDDIRRLAQSHEVTADLVVNHLSADSPEFRDYLANAEQSEFSGMFLKEETAFPGGATPEDLAQIYRPRPSEPFVTFSPAGHGDVRFWATFTEQQLDLNITDPATIRHLKGILELLATNGVGTVRLDAVGYVIKKRGTSCFMIDETYDFIDEITGWAHDLGLEVLAEIHAHYEHQIRIARHVDFVYDFALPPLLLHTLFQGNARALKDWLAISPRNAITVLDTHDGIGVMDVGPDRLNACTVGLLPSEQIDAMIEQIHANSGGVSRRASRHDVGNLDLYQVNCTYYDALGANDRDYLLARLIQFFVPGIPQVYYMGFLAGRNDEALLDQTGSGRDVNRSFYSAEAIRREMETPVVQTLSDLMRLRNHHAAFAGDFELLPSDDSSLYIRRENGDAFAELLVDFESRAFSVTYSSDGGIKTFSRFADLGRYAA